MLDLGFLLVGWGAVAYLFGGAWGAVFVMGGWLVGKLRWWARPKEVFRIAERPPARAVNLSLE